ncbi:nucleoside-diphosphate sugar epimerase/dehydratase [Nocardioides sp. HDW12B]|uniref:polysaccharide biosynthesis protein n=1 Tax=Nocardioides sp. HDW12B TaxID=2714939 RepID=UPI0019814B78|nr:nucleoside-diphosphate sugar epimerase/dehydratase [Nocardioides sp. HDW12B]
MADTAVWLACFGAFAVLRRVLEGMGARESAELTSWAAVLGLALTAAALHVSCGLVFRLHQGRAPMGSTEEMLSLTMIAGFTGFAVTVLNVLVGRPVPGSVPLAGAALATVVMATYRATYRASMDQTLWTGRRYEHRDQDGVGRAIVLGAGDAGLKLVRSMLADGSMRLSPVAMLDDDRARRHRRVGPVRVLGSREDVAAVAESTGARTLIIAIPSASSSDIRELSQPALDAGLEVKVLPPVHELREPGKVAVDDVRDIDVTDLLGRHQIDTDIDSMAGYLTGKRVLVTGAGGSIGSELCRQIAKFNPAELIMLDRDESALHAVQLSIYGRALLDSDDVVLGDIRDSLFVDALFDQRKPDVVFHAAALKHLPMLEQYPGEAVKTNVWGTLSILEAAKTHKVEKFVNISTDKAANPCSVLGYSKRLAEGLTAAVAADAEGTFLSVRFGNVLGSRGSVLTAFSAQIKAGGPVTVTDPDVTRYFMTVQEAVQLVIQAAAIGNDGEALVLDMGQPVSIDGVARQLIELSGEDIDVVYTGLRGGEKMHEELWGDGEADVRSSHPLVSHTPVPPFDALEARELDPWSSPDIVIGSFRRSVARMTRQMPAQRRGADEYADVAEFELSKRWSHT